MLEVGDTLDKYRLTSLLGQGGMGAVYAAENTLIGKKVAVKVLHPSFSEHEEVLQRFLQEARNAAAIEHPGIVEIFDFGWAELHGLRAPYLVMELLRGRSLADQLRGNDDQSELEFAVEVTLEVLSVLVSVHNKNIMHRDLKPENIFLCFGRDGVRRIKILDFGISKVKTDKGGGLTLTGTVLGTPYYMSPEQAHGVKDLDHRVDIWAMGAILYQMLTGSVPFEGDSYNEILSKIISRDFRPPRVLRPDLPEWIEEVTLKALAWERDERYRSAGDFLGDLKSRWETFAPAAGILTGGAMAGFAPPPPDDLAAAPTDRAAGSSTAKGLPPPGAPPAGSSAAPDSKPVEDAAAPAREADHDRIGTAAVHPPVTSAGPEAPATGSPSQGGEPQHAGAAPLASPSESAVVTRASGQTPVAIDSLMVTKAAPHRVSGPPDWAVGSGGAHLASGAGAGPPDSLTGTVRHDLQRGARRSPVPILAGVVVVLILGIAGGAAFLLRNRGEGQSGGVNLGAQSVSAAAGVDPAPPLTKVLPPQNWATTEPQGRADAVPTIEAVDPPDTSDLAAGGSQDDSRRSDREPRSTRDPRPDVAPQPEPPRVKSLDRAEVAAGIRSVSSKLKRCISQGGPAPPLVNLSIQIDGDGSATFLGAQPAPPAVVSSCLGSAISRVRYRTTGAPPLKVSYAVQTETPQASPVKAPREPPTKNTSRLKQNPFGN